MIIMLFGVVSIYLLVNNIYFIYNLFIVYKQNSNLLYEWFSYLFVKIKLYFNLQIE